MKGHELFNGCFNSRKVNQFLGENKKFYLLNDQALRTNTKESKIVQLCNLYQFYWNTIEHFPELLGQSKMVLP
jgi:hypothetical protein